MKCYTTVLNNKAGFFIFKIIFIFKNNRKKQKKKRDSICKIMFATFI